MVTVKTYGSKIRPFTANITQKPGAAQRDVDRHILGITVRTEKGTNGEEERQRYELRTINGSASRGTPH